MAVLGGRDESLRPGHTAGLTHVPPEHPGPLREGTRRLEPRGAGPARGGWDAVLLDPAPRCPCKALQGPARVHGGSLCGSCRRHKLFPERAQLQAPPLARPTGSVVHATAWLLSEKGTG